MSCACACAIGGEHNRFFVFITFCFSAFLFFFLSENLLLHLLQRVESVDKRAIEVPAWQPALVSDIGIAGRQLNLFGGKKREIDFGNFG